MEDFLGSGLAEAKGGCSGLQLADGLRKNFGFGRASEAVCGHHEAEAFDGFRLQSVSEPADGSVGGFVEADHVVGYEGSDTGADGIGGA